MKEISRETFLVELHDALNHLYNADLLRKSALAEVFGVSERFDTSAALRKILVDTIESLKPAPSEPDTSKAWRTYESLYCCFIQQLNQQVAADQLCISPRQLRREQRNALENLADLLWQKFRLGSPERAESEPASRQEAAPAAILLGELDWMTETQPAAPTHLSGEVLTALEVFQGLAQKSGVSLRSQIPADLPALAVHPAALNQILVSLVGVALSCAGTGGTVSLAARPLPAAVELSLSAAAETGQPASVAAGEANTSLEIAAELARVSGGRLYHGSKTELFPIRLLLPALEQFPVLVVDDNEDSLQLVKRYAAGSRYQLICTRNTEQVMELAETYRPRIIVLDIMMPKENGWIVLGRLRQHPLTSETPVIVSTILPQEKLALSLGANAFLKKPVSRQGFLQALDQQFALPGPEYL